MNRNFEKAIYDIEKVEDLMYAIESIYLSTEVMPKELGKADKAVNTFYALWDEINNVTEALEKLVGDEKVVDAIYAVNDVNLRRILTAK